MKLIQRIREEFEEAPWLRFTVDEAAQFWGLDEGACGQVFDWLIATGFLAAGIDERFGPRFSDISACRERAGSRDQVHR